MKNGKQETVGQIMMGSPVTLKPDDTLKLANDLISLGRIRHIPIVDGGKLLGLITQRDLLGRAADRILNLKEKNRAELLDAIMIKEIMQRRVLSVEPDTPISEAAHLMAERKIGCVPVLSDGNLVGLVTTTDILRYVERLEV
jgi:CBS domain-containing protein